MWRCVLVVSTVVWNDHWNWSSLLRVTCTMLFVGVQEWCGCICLRIWSNICSNLPHIVLRCTTLLVPPQCLSLPPSVHRSFSSLVVFLVGSEFQMALKTLWFIRLLAPALRVGRLLPLYILWRFCSRPHQGQAPRIRVSSLRCCFYCGNCFGCLFHNDIHGLGSWVAQLFYREISPPWLLALFLGWLCWVLKKTISSCRV